MKYFFRGKVVLEYDPYSNQLYSGKYNLEYFSFIPEDYKLLEEFFHKCYLHATGQPVELKDIEVD